MPGAFPRFVAIGGGLIKPFGQVMKFLLVRDTLVMSIYLMLSMQIPRIWWVEGSDYFRELGTGNECLFIVV